MSDVPNSESVGPTGTPWVDSSPVTDTRSASMPQPSSGQPCQPRPVGVIRSVRLGAVWASVNSEAVAMSTRSSEKKRLESIWPSFTSKVPPSKSTTVPEALLVVMLNSRRPSM